MLPSLRSIQHEKCSTKEEDIQFLEFWKYEDVCYLYPFHIMLPTYTCSSRSTPSNQESTASPA